MIKKLQLNYFIIITIVVLSSISCKLYADGNKHALIIAIGNYDMAVTGWGQINSENDIPLIKAALTSQGFDEENIAIIQDDAADRAGVFEAFNGLLESVSLGDYVVVHYSGHGQQISDDNADEIDGLDEALVLINAPSKYEAGDDYKGEQHLRDEELGALIDGLRQKVGKGGQVFVVLDACHSGTGTRGLATVRGGESAFIIPGQSTPNLGVHEEGFGMNESNVKSRGDGSDMAPFILFSGAKFDELNYETKDENGNGVGSLSFAVSKAFSEIDANSTYSSVFARVLEIMADIAPRQTPMIEGDYNYKLFNGEVVEQDHYFDVIKLIDNKKVQINGGNVTGISKGDKIGLYKSGISSIDDQIAILSGIVINTNSFNATIEFAEEHHITNLKSYWAFVEEYNLKNAYFGIYLEELDADLKVLLLEKLSNINNLSSIVENEEDADVLITSVKEKGKPNPSRSNTLYIKSIETGSVIEEVKLDKSKEAISSEIAGVIKDYTQGVFIKNIELNDENYKVEIEFIPVVPRAFDTDGYPIQDESGNYLIKDTLLIEDFISDGDIEFTSSDVVMIKIINTGKLDAYFSILDIQPNGIINALYPINGILPSECLIKAGDSFIPSNFIISGFWPPYGKEVIKVFANAEVIDLSQIVTSRGVGTRGLTNTLGALVKDSYQTRGTRPKTGTVSNKDTGSTAILPFTIKENR